MFGDQAHSSKLHNPFIQGTFLCVHLFVCSFDLFQSAVYWQSIIALAGQPEPYFQIKKSLYSGDFSLSSFVCLFVCLISYCFSQRYIGRGLLAGRPGTRLMQTDVLNTQRIHLATMNIVLFFICVFVFLFFSVFVFLIKL